MNYSRLQMVIEKAQMLSRERYQCDYKDLPGICQILLTRAAVGFVDFCDNLDACHEEYERCDK